MLRILIMMLKTRGPSYISQQEVFIKDQRKTRYGNHLVVSKYKINIREKFHLIKLQSLNLQNVFFEH